MDRPPPCKFYQSGCCFSEDACPYEHPTVRCRSFTNDGFCPYGVNCHYWHDQASTLTTVTSPMHLVEKPVCRFFLNGQCNYGDTCAFSHQLDSLQDESKLTLQEYRMQQTEAKRKQNSATRSSSYFSTAFPNSQPMPTEFQAKTNRLSVARPTARLEQAYIDSVQPEDLEAMKALEIDRLQKRFPADQLVEVSQDGVDTSIRSFALLFSSTDPDWSHDVKKILLRISLPYDYPFSPPALTVPRTSDLPNIVTENLNTAIEKWMSQRHQSYREMNKVALCLRPFFFWLDKKLQDLLTEGYQNHREAVETGVLSEILDEDEDIGPIPERLSNPGYSSPSSSSSSSPCEEDPVPGSGGYNHRTKDLSSPFLNQLDEQRDKNKSGNAKDNVENEKEEIFQVSPISSEQRIYFDALELRGQVGTCLFTRLPIFVMCSRCKYISEFAFRVRGNTSIGSSASSKDTCLESLPPYTSVCPRCHNQMGLAFTASLAHQFSSLIGVFHLASCLIMVVRYEEIEYQLQCTNCNSTLKIVGLQPDRLQAKRCQKCHSPCGIVFSNILLSGLEKASSELDKKFALMSVKCSSKSAPGKPVTKSNSSQAHLITKDTRLPNDGACKHYRKSFRWFRFPCCNRIYPCDLCHNGEAADSHEILFASRMICGFCSKEQPYSALAPCVACGQSLTGTRSTHWEGGKGCRDRTKMSRKDAKKYANASKHKPKGQNSK